MFDTGCEAIYAVKQLKLTEVFASHFNVVITEKRDSENHSRCHGEGFATGRRCCVEKHERQLICQEKYEREQKTVKQKDSMEVCWRNQIANSIEQP